MEKEFKNNKKHLSQIQMMVLEKNIATKVCEQANVVQLSKSYKEVMNNIKGN